MNHTSYRAHDGSLILNTDYQWMGRYYSVSAVFPSGADDYVAMEAHKDSLEESIKAGCKGLLGLEPVIKVFRLWLSKKEGLSPTTYRDYNSLIESQIATAPWAKKLACRLTAPEVAQWVAKYTGEPRRLASVLSQVSGWGLSEGYFGSPIYVRAIKPAKRAKGRRTREPKETAKILKEWFSTETNRHYVLAVKYMLGGAGFVPLSQFPTFTLEEAWAKENLMSPARMMFVQQAGTKAAEKVFPIEPTALQAQLRRIGITIRDLQALHASSR